MCEAADCAKLGDRKNSAAKAEITVITFIYVNLSAQTERASLGEPESLVLNFPRALPCCRADGEGSTFGRTRRIVSSALASRALIPSGRRRCALAINMLLKSHVVEPLPSVSSGIAFKRKTPADGEGFTFGRTRRIRTADLYHVKVAL
jgi:hypothetical protein